jgi:hypothetical protein
MNKKISFQLLLSTALFVLVFQSCKNDYNDYYQTYAVTVQLSYPDDYESAENVYVSLVNSTNSTTYTDSTDADGYVRFNVPSGIYDASVSEQRSVSGTTYLFTGNKSLTVSDTDEDSDLTTISLSVSKANDIIIKELYNGGCPKDDGSGTFYRGQYAILYNNSESSVSLDNLCLGATFPYNSNSTNYFYEDGELSFVAEGWIPAAMGIWCVPDGISLAPGEEIVIALNSAIDNTVTYSQAINFANAEYYTAYDIEVYSHETYYPSPSSLIPTSHYLSAVKYGSGSAWTFSYNSPAFYIFKTDGETPDEFANNPDNLGNYNGSSTMIYSKVPMEWVLDGIEVYRQGYDNQKRLPAAIDAGYVYHTNTYGYTLYRNVDQEATEALEENEGKIVYDYSGGTTDINDGSTDPSGIDAEASVANGVRIIYSDTNSSTNDFHQRAKASLRD